MSKDEPNTIAHKGIVFRTQLFTVEPNRVTLWVQVLVDGKKVLEDRMKVNAAGWTEVVLPIEGEF